jgi:four helix bundle protein
MQTKFRTYDLAVQFYREAKTIQLPAFLKNQLLRAASSVALNLQEGNGRSSRAERRNFFNIAYASMRETQAVIQLEPQACKKLMNLADQLAAHLFCLRRSLK